MKRFFIVMIAIAIVVGFSANSWAQEIKLACRNERTDGTHGTIVYLFDSVKLTLDGHKNGDKWTEGGAEYGLSIDDATINFRKNDHGIRVIYKISRIDGSYEVEDKSDGAPTKILASGKCSPLKQAF